MNDLRQAAMLALEALEDERYVTKYTHIVDAINALRTALEQPEQEPVACVIDGDLYFHHEIDWEDLAYQGHGVELLYTTPPAAQPEQVDCPRCGHVCSQRKWVGLTDEDVNRESAMIASKMKLAFHAGMYVAQQILKERNT